MNNFWSLGREQGSRVGLLVALGLAAGLIGMLMMAGSASAGTIICGGKIGADTAHEAKNSLKYEIQCTENITGYSIVSNREVDYFSTEVTNFDPAGEVLQGQQFTCEGPIPGYGIGCYGIGSAGAVITGSIGTTEELCEASVQPKFWVVALSTQEGKAGKLFNLTSEPFQLPIKCDTLDAKKKAKDKAIKLCAAVKAADSKKSRTAARKRCQEALRESRKLNNPPAPPATNTPNNA